MDTVNTPDDIFFNLEPAQGKGAWLPTGQDHIHKVTMRVTTQKMKTQMPIMEVPTSLTQLVKRL